LIGMISFSVLNEIGQERSQTITWSKKKYKKSPKRPCHKRIFPKIR